MPITLDKAAFKRRFERLENISDSLVQTVRVAMGGNRKFKEQRKDLKKKCKEANDRLVEIQNQITKASPKISDRECREFEARLSTIKELYTVISKAIESCLVTIEEMEDAFATSNRNIGLGINTVAKIGEQIGGKDGDVQKTIREYKERLDRCEIVYYDEHD